MTKAELVEKVASTIKLSQKETEVIVGIILQSITESLSAGDKVELRGFGSFRIRVDNIAIPALGYLSLDTYDKKIM